MLGELLVVFNYGCFSPYSNVIGHIIEAKLFGSHKNMLGKFLVIFRRNLKAIMKSSQSAGIFQIIMVLA